MKSILILVMAFLMLGFPGCKKEQWKLAITAPVNGSNTYNSSIQIRGTLYLSSSYANDEKIYKGLSKRQKDLVKKNIPGPTGNVYCNNLKAEIDRTARTWFVNNVPLSVVGQNRVFCYYQDSAGNTSQQTIIVNRASQPSPVANLLLSTQEDQIPFTISANGSGSYLPGQENTASRGIKECVFTLINLAKSQKLTGNCMQDFQITVAGSYSIKLDITAINDKKATISKSFKALDNSSTSPVANFTLSSTEGIIPFTVSVDGSPSYLPGHENDSDRGIDSCEWTLFGPLNKIIGKWTQTNCQTSFFIEHVGVSHISLTVKSINNQSATITRLVKGNPAANLPPVPNFEQHEGSQPREFTFDGSSSYDPDGNIVEYHWDFGDGISGEGMSSTHVYNEDGMYLVNLTVIDDKGLSNTIQRSVSVTTLNQLPLVDFNYTQTTQVAPFEFNLDASSSVDPDGSIVSYTWLIDSSVTLSGKVINYSFPDSGQHTILLTVLDNNGGSSSIAKELTIDVVNSVFSNPEFENGSGSGWAYSGVLEIVKRCTYFDLQPLMDASCDDGKFAALISNAIDSDPIGELRQKFIVGNCDVKIEGKIRFLTNELAPYLKSFDDMFQVKLITDSGEIIISQGSVTTTPLGAGVGGYEYSTAVMPIEIPLSTHRTKSVTLVFKVLDIDDYMIDSGIAITDLTLVKE